MHSYRDVLLEIRKTLLYLFLPSPCLACGAVDRDLERPLGLCLRCRGRLVRLREPCCPTCARPLPAAAVPSGFRCGRCRLRRPSLDRLIAHWAYQDPLDGVIVGLKFRRLRFLGRQLGRRLARRLRCDPPAIDVVVPVPLHWWRELERGYNQAEEIARAVAAELGLPLEKALARRRNTKPQTELPRGDRRANLRSAFRCRRPSRIAGRRILLVDDVVTTGATLEEAATVLRRSGAGAVLAAVVARTPEPGEPEMVSEAGPGVRSFVREL